MTDYYSNEPNPYSNQYGNQTTPSPYANPPAQNPYPGSAPYSNPVPAQNPYSNPVPAQPQSSPYSNPTPVQNPPSTPFPSASHPPATARFPDASTFGSSYYSSGQQGPRSRTPIILIVVAVLMLAAGGVFGALYISANSDHDKASSTLADRKAELDGIKKDITTAQGDKTKAEDNNSDLESQNSALQPCVDATQKFLWDTPQSAPEAEIDAAVQAMKDACT